MKVILASGSETRKRVLRELGIDFEVIKSDVNEDEIKNKCFDPQELVLKLADAKAECVASKCEDSIIVAADTMVTFGNEILGKPKSFEGAVEMMMNFSGKEHHIISGFCLINTSTKNKVLKFLDTAAVFNNYSEKEIRDYLSKTDPTKYAGAYVLKDLISNTNFVKEVKGNLFDSGIDPDVLKLFIEQAGYLNSNE